MAHSEGDESLSRRRRSFTVAASPFNSVKFDLAIILVLGVLLFLIHDQITPNTLYQLLILGGYGMAAMFWVVTKTRRIARQAAQVDRQE